VNPKEKKNLSSEIIFQQTLIFHNLTVSTLVDVYGLSPMSIKNKSSMVDRNGANPKELILLKSWQLRHVNDMPNQNKQIEDQQ